MSNLLTVTYHSRPKYHLHLPHIVSINLGLCSRLHDLRLDRVHRCRLSNHYRINILFNCIIPINIHIMQIQLILLAKIFRTI